MKIVTSGKRKTAIARAILTKGVGKIKINKRDYQTLHIFDRLKIEEPLRIGKEILGKINFDASINVRGGGEKGQIDAARVALARAFRPCRSFNNPNLYTYLNRRIKKNTFPY